MVLKIPGRSEPGVLAEVYFVRGDWRTEKQESRSKKQEKRTKNKEKRTKSKVRDIEFTINQFNNSTSKRLTNSINNNPSHKNWQFEL
jgi:hypothetical protein